MLFIAKRIQLITQNILKFSELVDFRHTFHSLLLKHTIICTIENENNVIFLFVIKLPQYVRVCVETLYRIYETCMQFLCTIYICI